MPSGSAGANTGKRSGTSALTLRAAKPAYLNSASTARCAVISKTSSGFLRGSFSSSKPPSQVSAASASSTAAPFSPAQTKNSRLNAPSAPLRRGLGSSQYTASESGRKINKNCTEENAI